ncbi:hypothetical protein Tco_0043475, partial [Tanacetum coccineum]
RNHVRKFLRALPSKWRPKVSAIEESKDLSKLSLDELVGNLKVYEVVLEKESNCVACNKGKQQKASYKAITVVSTIFEPTTKESNTRLLTRPSQL